MDAEASDCGAKIPHHHPPDVSDADHALSRRSRSIASPATPPKPRMWDDDNAFHAFQVEHSKLGVDLTISCDELPTSTTDRNKLKSKERKKHKISMGHVEIVMSELDNAGFIAQRNLNRLQVRYSTDGHRDLGIQETDRTGSPSSQQDGRFDDAENRRSRLSTAPHDHSPVHEAQDGPEGGRALQSGSASCSDDSSRRMSRSPPLRHPSHISISSSSSRGESSSSSEAQQTRKDIVESSHQIAEQEDLSPYLPCENRLETPFPLHDQEPNVHRRPPNLASDSTKTNRVSPGGFIRASQEPVRESSHIDHDTSLAALEESHDHRDASCVPQDEAYDGGDTSPLAEEKSYVDQDPLYNHKNKAYKCQDLVYDGQDTVDDGPDTVYDGQDTADGGRDTADGGQDTPYDRPDESHVDQQASYAQQDPEESHAFQEGYHVDPEESHVAQDAPGVDNDASRAIDNHQTRICQPQPESNAISPEPPSSPVSRVDEQADHTDDDEDRSDEEIMSRLDSVDSGHDLRRGRHDGSVEEEHEEEQRAPSAAPELRIPKNSESNPITISSSPSPSAVSIPTSS